MALTDTACKNAKCPPDRNRLRLADSGGLYLEALPNGSKAWRWKYRFLGKEKRLALGLYPTVTLAMARRARDSARETLRARQDPVQVKKDAKAAQLLKAENTFQSVADEWFAKWKNEKSVRHADYVKRRLEADVYPEIGRRPIADVTPAMLIAMAEKIEKRGALDIARRALQTCGQIFRYAVKRQIIVRSPSSDIKPSEDLTPRKKKHYARLDASEFPELLRKIKTYQGTPYTRIALELIALTFVRTSELIEAKWSEFNLDVAEWRIPPERMKMDTMHIVPLSRQAVDHLKCLQELKGLSDYLFPGERDHEKPMSNNTILKALATMGFKGRMTGHGFRGLASTILHEKQFPHEHIELQLAHQERDEVSAAYNFATYLPQRRGMVQWYADHLDELRQGAKVIPLRAA